MQNMRTHYTTLQNKLATPATFDIFAALGTDLRASRGLMTARGLFHKSDSDFWQWHSALWLVKNSQVANHVAECHCQKSLSLLWNRPQKSIQRDADDEEGCQVQAKVAQGCHQPANHFFSQPWRPVRKTVHCNPSHLKEFVPMIEV